MTAAALARPSCRLCTATAACPCFSVCVLLTPCEASWLPRCLCIIFVATKLNHTDCLLVGVSCTDVSAVCHCVCGVRLSRYSPRANIFRRDQGGASSVEDLKHLMRSNDYEHDKLLARPPPSGGCMCTG